MISENTAAASFNRCTGSLFFASSVVRTKVVMRSRERAFSPRDRPSNATFPAAAIGGPYIAVSSVSAIVLGGPPYADHICSHDFYHAIRLWLGQRPLYAPMDVGKDGTSFLAAVAMLNLSTLYPL